MSTTYSDLQYTTFPDAIQAISDVLNIVAEDAPYINGYQEAMREGDYLTAQQYFSQITNGNQKFIDAQKINTLIDTCVALERFFANDIIPYVNNLQQNWQAEVDKFTYRGDWVSTTLYYKNNFVTATVNGVYGLYLCISDTSSGINITNTNYWLPLTIRGARGESGATMSFRYEWDSSESYSIGDIVTYNDAIWNCLSANTNQEPKSNSNYWSLIYNSSQVIYPFSSSQPSGSITSGSLWFERI